MRGRHTHLTVSDIVVLGKDKEEEKTETAKVIFFFFF